MSKTNTKASATQVSQDMAAAAAADQAASQEQTTTVVTTTAAEQEAATLAAAEEAALEAATAPTPKEPDLVVTPTPAPVAKPTPTVVHKATVVEATKPVAANAAVTETLATILKDVPAAYQLDISRVQTYIERMAPKRPVDQKVGCAEQLALYKAIQNIINRQDQYFTQLFSALLFLFKSEMNGALGDRYRMRFMDNVALHTGDRKAFATLTQTLSILADPKSRALAMSQVNMERALENGLTADGRNRVLNYFNV